MPSGREFDQVVVHNFFDETTRWMTPAEAKRFISVNPIAEVIDELDPDWSYYAQKAGPKPLRLSDPIHKPDESE